MSQYQLNHLKQLEAEAIYIIREALSLFERPVLLFSGGKDSITLFHLLKKSYYPQKIGIPLLHVDTGHNFQETISFRDTFVQKEGVKLMVASVEESIDKGDVVEEKGVGASRNFLQSATLMKSIEENQFDCLFGGARRDEEKARAKERFFSHRNEFGEWDPKNQRPELFGLQNGHLRRGEHFRVFPLSNWTELDVWQYILEEKIDLPSLYFAHERRVFERQKTIYAYENYVQLSPEEEITIKNIRFRTIGDVTCTGAVESTADSVEKVIEEIKMAKVTERGTRMDDQRSETAMEDRKKQGYF